MRLGDFEIAHVRAATYQWDSGAFFGVVPRTLWGRKMPADALNRITVAMNCYVLRTGDRTLAPMGLLAVGLGESSVLGKVRYFAKKALPELARAL